MAENKKLNLKEKLDLKKAADLANKVDLSGLKNFDWRSLKKYASPRAMNDLNRFLENMPSHVTQSMMIAAAVSWGAAGVLGLYTTVQLKSLTELRATFSDAEALTPVVPQVKNMTVPPSTVSEYAQTLDEIYNGLEIKAQGSNITMTSETLNAFGQFREAIGHSLNGGSGWRVEVEKMCIGRECSKYPLSVTLKINKVSVSNPN